MNNHPVVTIFGGGQCNEASETYQDAFLLGEILAQNGYIICNGGYGGIMEASSKGAKHADGQTVAVITKDLNSKVNCWSDRVETKPGWRERLFGLMDEGDAFVFLDGGSGTLTELFVAWEMANRKLHCKPLIIHGAFVIDFMKGLSGNPQFRFNELIRFAETVPQVVSILKDYLPAHP